jgi:hypothetical protein
LVLFCGDFYHWGILIGLVKVLYANDLRDFTLGEDWQADRLQTLKLYLQKPFDGVVFPYRGDLHCNLHLCPLPLANLEPHLLKVLKPLIAPHREDILVEIVEFGIVAFGDHPQHERVRPIIFDDFVLEADGDVYFFDRTREES